MKPHTWMAKHKSTVASFFLGLALSWLLFTGPFLIARDDLRVADAIVVIGGDHKPERMYHAGKLYHREWAPVIILSGGTTVLVGTNWMSEAELMRIQARDARVPQEALLLEDQSLSTRENAVYTGAMCREQGITSILLVTSAHHSRRARRIFEDVLGDELEIRVQPALEGVDHWSWWLRLDRIVVTFYEYGGWAKYWWDRLTA